MSGLTGVLGGTQAVANTVPWQYVALALDLQERTSDVVYSPRILQLAPYFVKARSNTPNYYNLQSGRWVYALPEYVGTVGNYTANDFYYYVRSTDGVNLSRISAPRYTISMPAELRPPQTLTYGQAPVEYDPLLTKVYTPAKRGWRLPWTR